MDSKQSYIGDPVSQPNASTHHLYFTNQAGL
jgi:hypothetical protein